MASRGSQEVERHLLRLLHGSKTRTRFTEIHAHLLRHHLHHSNQLLSHFISVSTSFNRMQYASRVFRQSPNPNILLFNSMIKAHSLHPPFGNSVHFFSMMKRRGIWPDEFTLAPLLKSCSNLQDLKLGQGVYKELIVLGFERFSSVRIGVVELYVNCERMDYARRLFDEMSHRDVVVWNLMVRGYSRSGDVATAFSLFLQMGERTVVSWNTMISGLAQCGRDKEALDLFNEMHGKGFKSDEATVVTLLPVCARLGELEAGMRIHSYAKSSGIYCNFVSVGNALVDFYCKCGDLDNAFIVFRDMPKRNVVSWNAMISGVAFNGKGERGIELFEEMIGEGVKPNESTFVGVLACCVHAGLAQRGRELFTSMSLKFHLEPKLEHYGCMVDILGRTGCVREAFDLIQSMPMKANAALWGALLSACRTYGDSDLAEYAIKELISLEPRNSGNYVLLSNIYAEGGRWDEVDKLRLVMKGHGVTKVPGQSMVG